MVGLGFFLPGPWQGWDFSFLALGRAGIFPFWPLAGLGLFFPGPWQGWDFSFPALGRAGIAFTIFGLDFFLEVEPGLEVELAWGRDRPEVELAWRSS